MRDLDTRQEGMFSYVSLESRIPKDHPLRPIREMVDDALKGLTSDEHFSVDGTMIEAVAGREAPA